MTRVPPEQLALEVEDIIRTMPGPRDFSANPDKCVPWLGRASAAVSQWNSIKAIAAFEPLVATLTRSGDFDFSPTIRAVRVVLHQAHSDLRMASTGPLSVAVGSGRPFEYFDELRRVVEQASTDAFFIDPYIDAEFVSRYLPFVGAAAQVRILAREKVATLKPAIEAFLAQSPRRLEVRTAQGFHDRYVLVDGLACYQSGASFKDGAKRAPTTLTQITDAFEGVWQTYEQLWNQGTVVVAS